MVNEKNLSQSHEFADNIINTIREPLIVLDQDLRVVSASRSFYEVFKVTPGETVGQLIYDLGNKQWDIPGLRELLENILPEKISFDNYEVEHVFASIGRRTILLNARRIEQVWGKDRIILLAFEDITERRRLEDLLTESELRYRRLFETASDGIVLLEKNKGQIKHANPAMEKMLGYSEAEILGEKLQDIGVSIDTRDFSETMLELNREGILNYVDVPLKTKSGKDICTDIYAVDRAELVQYNIRDVTERKQVIEKLQKAQRYSHQIITSAQEGFIVYDTDLKFRLWNRFMEQLTGISADEIMGKDLRDTFPALVESGIAAAVEKALTGETCDITRFHFSIPQTGKSGWAAQLNSPFRNSAGEIIGVIGTVRDITQLVRTEEALIESQKILEGVINAIPVRVFWKNTNLVFLGCNSAFARDAGFAEPKDIIGKDDYEMKWREQAELYRNDDIQVLTSGDSRLHKEEPQTTPEGNIMTLLTSKIPLRNDEGKIIGVIGTYMDISARKQAEEALLAAERKFKNLLETVNLIAIMLDCDASIVFCNDYFLQLTGWTRDEVLNKNWFAMFLPADIRETVRSIFTATMEKGDFPLLYENSIITRDGQRKDIEWNNCMLRDPKGTVTGMASIGTDVTEHKKLQAQLLQAQKMEAVGTLAGGVAHDFNNILNVIMGYGDLVMDNLAADSPAREDMSEVLVAAERAAILTRRLLAFSRKEVAEISCVNINALILSLEKMLARIIRESIECHLHLADTPLIVRADAGQIEQVLINLASNAKDAMLEGGRLLITTSLDEIDEANVAAYGYGLPGKYALITVSDTGHGMAAEIQKKIFEPYFSTKEAGKGTGLGLAISYGIIKQHNGFIKVYSEPDEGTVFKIYLPLCDEALLDKKPEGIAPVKGGHETVLVAEDDTALRKLSKVVLESFGYTVITAKDGEEALTKFLENRERINLVLLDMIMPKKNGKEVSEAICKVSPKIKILFASGYTIEIITRKKLEESGFDFIQKPYQSKNLLLKVREVLDN